MTKRFSTPILVLKKEMTLKKNIMLLLMLSIILVVSGCGKNQSGVKSAATGAGWKLVGPAGFTEGDAGRPSFQIFNGTPYISYSDGIDQAASVMAFNGNKWAYVGKRGFSGGPAYYTSMCVYQGVPYVAYKDLKNPAMGTVMEYKNNNWVNVGGNGFSKVEVWYTSIQIDNNGTPYVAYTDWANEGRATVMKFNGSDWVNVGKAGVHSLVPCGVAFEYCRHYKPAGGLILHRSREIHDSSRALRDRAALGFQGNGKDGPEAHASRAHSLGSRGDNLDHGAKDHWPDVAGF